ncbi:hypothetical protein PIB30_091934, partial [Stylosanthes scabra]|nr:hypothetical protein [Stylosanthes scabra]
GVKPDVVTYTSLMDGVNQVDKATCTFNKMAQRGVAPNVQSYNIMVNGLCKIIMVDQALNLLEEMHHKNLMACDGLCKSRRISCALELLEKMHDRGQPANLITYNSLLDGMFKNQELDKALVLFNKMIDIGIELNIYTSTILIDGLCKGGRLMDAK